MYLLYTQGCWLSSIYLWLCGDKVKCELRVASCKLRVASCKLRVARCELQVASCELQKLTSYHNIYFQSFSTLRLILVTRFILLYSSFRLFADDITQELDCAGLYAKCYT